MPAPVPALPAAPPSAAAVHAALPLAGRLLQRAGSTVVPARAFSARALLVAARPPLATRAGRCGCCASPGKIHPAAGRRAVNYVRRPQRKLHGTAQARSIWIPVQCRRAFPAKSPAFLSATLPSRARDSVFCRPVAAFHCTVEAQKQIVFSDDRLRYYKKVGSLPSVLGKVTNWSFYQFVALPGAQLEDLRDKLLELFLDLDVRGRVYIATEGINAQIACPDRNFQEMKRRLEETLPGVEPGSVDYNEGMSNDFSFSSLHVRIRKALVNDGLGATISTLKDSTPQATHLPPAEFHRMLTEEIDHAKKEGTAGPLIVDLRNHYESAVGRFEGAITLDSDTYREGYAMLENELAKRDQVGKKPVFLYCTGGIRCTRSGSALIQQGLDNMFVLKGGVTAYGHFLKQNPQVTSLYRGKNFTFDARLGEPITDDVLTLCQLCPPNGHDGKSAPEPCDRYVNCINRQCNMLMIQCRCCQEKYSGTCGSKACLDALAEARKVNALAGTRTQPDQAVRKSNSGSMDGPLSDDFVRFGMKGCSTWYPHELRSRPSVLLALLDGSFRRKKVAVQEGKKPPAIATS